MIKANTSQDKVCKDFIIYRESHKYLVQARCFEDAIAHISINTCTPFARIEDADDLQQFSSYVIRAIDFYDIFANANPHLLRDESVELLNTYTNRVNYCD